MSYKIRVSAAAQALVAAGMVAALVAACGGGSSPGTTGFAQSYTSTAGVGEVLQFGVDTAHMTYSYKVAGTSYSASGVAVGQGGSGSLLGMNPNGSYNVGPSGDGFILGGKVLPLQNGLLVGHVQLSLFGSTYRIPVFGVSNPITTVAGLDGTYNYQGFSCNALGIADASGVPGCLSHFGTVSVASGVYNTCKGGDITTSPTTNACVAAASGVIQALPTIPGVFDYRNASGSHAGWFFAFTAPNGQKVAVIDHDDAANLVWGHTVLATYASEVSGAGDGKYLVKNNEGGESLLAVSGVSLTDTNLLGITVTGTMTQNAPWSGLDQYNFTVSGVSVASGVAMTAGTGVYTYTSNSDPAVFGVGIRYSP